MWISNIQNRALKDIAVTAGLMAMTFLATAYGLWVMTTGMAIAALLTAWLVVKDFIKLNHYARLLPKSRVHEVLREQKIFRPLANHLLRVADVPTRIPTGAMNALKLGDCAHTKDGSPLDWPVYWDSPDSYLDKWYYWRRTDKPIVAVQNPDGTWESQAATY